MSPEQSLIEFISTSASLHGVKKMSLRNLEWDLLKVCAIVHLINHWLSCFSLSEFLSLLWMADSHVQV